MSLELKRVEIINGEFRAHWHIVTEGVKIGERMMQARTGIEGLEAFITQGPVLAQAILEAEDTARANASAIAEAARLAELERWNALTPEEQAAEIAANTPPPPVPEQVSRYQLLKRLASAPYGIAPSQIEAMLTSEVTFPSAIQRELNLVAFGQPIWFRNDPLVQQLAAALSLDADQVFREASLL